MRGLSDAWRRTPLYLRIVAALVLGVATGVLLRAAGQERIAVDLEIPARLILRLLGTLAPPLILVAVIHALMNAEMRGPMARRMIFLLILNTLVAIGIGLVVANVIQPGRAARLTPPARTTPLDTETDPERRRVLETLERYNYKPAPPPKDTLTAFLDNVPRSIVGPLSDNGSVLGVIFLAVAFGLALRQRKAFPIRTVSDVVQVAFDTLIHVLHWVIALVPLGVFGIVASIVGVKGFAPFAALGWFIISVITALFLQAVYYLLRIRFGSWVRPAELLRGTRDALVMAFSTASSTATMPITYARLRDNVKLREESASMGALVGSNFNNDGTALYEAMSALFIAQMLGMDLSLGQQVMVVLTSVVASVGAAGIPEAGLVTMTLVFTAVGLPTAFIALLLTVDWFLDRCRTTINVMGDMNISCLLDGREPPEPGTREERTAAAMQPA